MVDFYALSASRSTYAISVGSSFGYRVDLEVVCEWIIGAINWCVSADVATSEVSHSFEVETPLSSFQVTNFCTTVLSSGTMALSRSALALLILSVSCAAVYVNGCVVNVRNNCGFAVTACSQSRAQNIAQYNLGAGQSKVIDLGAACTWPAAVVYASVTGKCAVSGTPNAATDRNLANLAEFTIGGGTDFYDLSNVNAYTIKLSIRPSNGGCKSISCFIGDISSFCRPNNKLITHSTGAKSCINTDGTAGRGPTDGTKQFKSACRDAYSYNFDDATSTFTCGTGTNYDVVFC